MKNSYNIIHNCNFDRDSKIMLATKAVEGGWTADEDLVAALDALEETLTEHADSDSVDSLNACRNAEREVEVAFTAEIEEMVEQAKRARWVD